MQRIFLCWLVMLMAWPAGNLWADEATELNELRAELTQLRTEYETRIAALEQRLAAAEVRVPPPKAAAANVADTAGDPTAFNPAIGLVLNGRVQSFSRGGDDAIPGFATGGEAGRGPEGFSLGESEMDLTANIDDKFYGAFTGTFINDDGADSIEIEQAYIQTTALPGGLSLKMGRDFSAVGYLNEFHAHADDFADRPLPYRAFLNGQYKDDGIQVRWLPPFGQYVELGGEWFRGDQFPAGGAANSGAGAWGLFARTGGDIGYSNSWQAGLGYLSAESKGRQTGHGDEFTGDSDMLVAHLVWKWAPNGNPTVHNFKLQAEAFWRNEDGSFTSAGLAPAPYDERQSGWYAQTIYQFRPQWRAGLRYAGLSANDPGMVFDGTSLDRMGHNPSSWSAMLDWSNSEFSRIRLQYSLDESRPQTDNQWILQYIYSLGAHGAHQF